MQVNFRKKLRICFDQRVHVLNALFDSSIVSHSPYRNAKLFHNNMLDLNDISDAQLQDPESTSEKRNRE